MGALVYRIWIGASAPTLVQFDGEPLVDHPHTYTEYWPQHPRRTLRRGLAKISREIKTKTSQIAAEQSYFDEALEHREKSRATLRKAPSAAVHKGAASAIRGEVENALSRLGKPDDGVAFGRFDTEAGEAWYVGYNAIHNETRDVLVVNWRAPVAAPYFGANYDDALGLRSRRTFECEKNTIKDFEEVLFEALAAEVASLAEPKIDDVLLSDLERVRTGEMQDIVRTIQAAQYEIIRAIPDQLLVVQGGAGTGKTAVGLHRVSWLLYNHRRDLKPSDVLVVGPNRTFIRYIRKLLPSLGDEDIDHSELEALLGTPVALGREEKASLIKVKGAERMRHLIQRGLSARIGLPSGPLEIRSRGRLIRLDRAALETFVDRLQPIAYLVGRQRLREHLRDLVTERTDLPPSSDVETEAMLERIWPQMTAASFLQELLGSESRLIGAAGEDFSAAEVRMLYRRASDRLATEVWSNTDVPLLDYADFTIRGEAPRVYRHIVIDECQDLSPHAAPDDRPALVGGVNDRTWRPGSINGPLGARQLG